MRAKGVSSGAHGERGAVILLVTFSLIALFGFAALALDLSRMYIVKSQLQNAADAGALRAAKELDGTLAGLNTAVSEAREAAHENRLFMANLVVDDDPQFASKPFSVSWSQAGSGECAATTNNCYFARVTTSATGIVSLFAGIIGGNTTAPRAVAVAGRHMVDITPMAMCALDLAQCPSSTCTTEDCRCGYELGKAYTVSEVNTGSSDKFWIDPIATSTSTCISGTNATRPYVCEGKTSPSMATEAKVYTTTGTRTTLLDELDSRFGDYRSNECDEATAPPDTNVMEYRFGDVGWISSLSRQTTVVTQVTRDPWSGTADNDGVLWTFRRPLTISLSNYPAPRTGRTSKGTPYDQVTGSRYFCAPTDPSCTLTPVSLGTPTMAERRVLNLFVVPCPMPTGSCREMSVQMIGQFFMQTRASQGGEIYLEFGDLITPGQLQAEIKLYQ